MMFRDAERFSYCTNCQRELVWVAAAEDEFGPYGYWTSHQESQNPDYLLCPDGSFHKRSWMSTDSMYSDLEIIIEDLQDVA